MTLAGRYASLIPALTWAVRPVERVLTPGFPTRPRRQQHGYGRGACAPRHARDALSMSKGWGEWGCPYPAPPTRLDARQYSGLCG